MVAGEVAGAIVRALADFFGLLHDPAPIIAVQRFFGEAPFWARLFPLVSELGDSSAAALAILLAFWFRQRRLAYALLVAVGLAAITDGILWQVVNAPRPADPRVAVREMVGVSSFPSGHTMTATAVWGTLAAEDEIPWFVAIFLVAAVMISRLYLGVHFLRDLLGAVLIGTTWIVVRRRIWPALAAWFARRSPGAFLIPAIVAAIAALIALPAAPNGRQDVLAAIAGAALALALEYRFVRYTPTPTPPALTIAKLLIGLGGIVALFLAAHSLDDGAPPLAVVATALIPLWGFVAAPVIIARLVPPQPRAAPALARQRGD